MRPHQEGAHSHPSTVVILGFLMDDGTAISASHSVSGLTRQLGRWHQQTVEHVRAWNMPPWRMGGCRAEEDILPDLMSFSRTLTQDGQLRWIGPEKGVRRLSAAASDLMSILLIRMALFVAMVATLSWVTTKICPAARRF